MLQVYQLKKEDTAKSWVLINLIRQIQRYYFIQITYTFIIELHQHAQEKEDEDALQKEKASILNRIKKKLHIKKEDANGNGSNEGKSPSEIRRNNSERDESRHRISDDDMKMYDASDDDEESKYVPSMPDIFYEPFNFNSYFLLF